MTSGFDSPHWFWLLLAIPGLAVFAALALRARREAIRRLVGDVAPGRLAPQAGRDRRALEAAFGALTVGLIACALAGPRWGEARHSVERVGSDVVLVIDASRSMLATDVRPSRIERVRREIRGLLDTAPGVRVAIVTFAGDARLLCPLTLDHDTVRLFLDEIDPAYEHRGGSSLARALEAAGTALEASAGAAGRAVVVFSDGEDLKDPDGKAAAAVARRLAARGVQVHAVGVGTPEGARIPVEAEASAPGIGADELLGRERDARGSGARFFRDASGNEVVTKLVPEPLAAMAAAGSGEFLDTGRSAFPMDELWRKRISRLAKGDLGAQELATLEPRFQWLLVPALFAAMGWWMAPLGADRRRSGARVRGRLVAAVSALVAFACFPLAARADAVDEGAKGDVLYRAGDYAGAAAAYEYATAGVETEHAYHNLGNARFRQGNYQAAAKAFAEAERKAVDRDSRRDASYNRGLALLKAAEAGASADGDPAAPVETLRSSIDAFNAALRLDPTDEAARHNRAVAIARWVRAQQGREAGKGKGEGKGAPSEAAPPGSSGDPAPGRGGEGQDPPDPEGEGEEQGEGEGEGEGKEGNEPDPDGARGDAGGMAARELDRIERMLDAREQEQRRLEKVKSRMHRRGGEHEW